MNFRRPILLALVAGAALGASRRAGATTDTRFVGDDVRISVDDAGIAHVEHALSYKVTGSFPRGLDLNGVEPEAVLDPAVAVILDGDPLEGGASIERKSDGVLHVTLDARAPARRNSARAALVVRVRYAVDLAEAHELTLDGAMWRIHWVAPVAPEGYDLPRVVFELPAAPTEPRVVASDGAPGAPAEDGDLAELVTLRRGAQHDELELSRPHVARGEAAEWSARVDPRAFGRVTAPSLRPAPPPTAEPEPRGRTAAWIVVALVGVIFGALVRAKSAAYAGACKECGVVAVGIPPLARAWLGGVALAAGITAELAGLPTLGALGVVLAMAFATVSAPRASPSPRGPGQWLALSPAEAFADDGASDPLDVATLAGKAVFVVVAIGAVALGLALRTFDSSWLWLAPLDALALLPLFVTGSRGQLPPDRARAPRRRLRSLHRALRRETALRVSPWARVPVGSTIPDELRLLVLPRAAIPGVVGIEVGVAWVATHAGYTPETEVLVRVREATAAAARMVALGAHRPVVHGRRTEERVIRLVPAVPSRAGALELVRRLTRELHDRRKSLPGIRWSGAERRLPPNERLRPGAVAAVAAA